MISPYTYHDYDDYNADYDCASCDSLEKSMAGAAHYLEAIINALYSGERLDIGVLENHLEELAHVLKIRLPKGVITIQRKSALQQIITEWKSFNNNYLTSIGKHA
jgi:hypothetical protein